MAIPAERRLIHREIRRFGSGREAHIIADLTKIQTESYSAFLQEETASDKRKDHGLEGVLREVVPIESDDGQHRLEYVKYELGKPRYTPTECRQLRLTYGRPFRIWLKLMKEQPIEEEVYLGDIPIMLGGGEFIINGAERVVVSQLHRSPGVDFVMEQEGTSDRKLPSCRIIPERGSWIELNCTKRETLSVRIDQSGKFSALTLLRAMSPKYSTDSDILREFYETTTEKIVDGRSVAKIENKISVDDVCYPASSDRAGEIIVEAGHKISKNQAETIATSGVSKVEVIEAPKVSLLLNSLADDTTASHEEALLRIYQRLRPGNPPQLEKAKTLFNEKFYDVNRYRLGRVGRFRLNRKLKLETPEKEMTLRAEDLIAAIRYLMDLMISGSEAHIDDIDHLGNRRLRTIDELASDELRKGFLKLRRTVQERMSLKDLEDMTPRSLVNPKSISAAIEYFFGRGELSQVVDQTNPLSQLTHERRLSALGPGGLNRKRAGFEVRDVHISHYGRICPIETPEGTNIGLIASLSIYSDIDEYGFLITPYRVVEDGKVNGQHKYLRADEEMKTVLAPPDVVEKDHHLRKGMVLARVQGDLATVPSKEIQYVDVSPRQTVSVSAALIPFLEHDDANRALMGSNMQRQAVPLLRTDPPVIATGMERPVAQNSGMLVRAERAGVVTSVDASRILVDNADEYVLRKFVGLNERTCLNQKPIVKKGQRVKKGQIIADGAATHQGELALGRNVLVAFMTYDGYNFEDAIVISQRLVKEDTFTSIHIEEYDVEIRETKLGREEFTRDIPNVSERALANLDEVGVVCIGTRVGPGDILVGKIAPKSKSELTPEEKLLHAIFGRAGEDVKNDSLEMPAGEEGVVIGAQRFSRRMHMSDEQKKDLKKNIDKYEKEMNVRAIAIFKQMVAEINEVTGQQMVDPNTRQKVGQSENIDIVMEQIDTFKEEWVKGSRESKEQAINTYSRFWPRVQAVLKEKNRRMEHMKRGDELPSGVLEMVKVYVATKRALSVGDKMAGRHGNKGVIARIVPEEDMPFLEDGTPVDILLNPLGVPSRMNVGQILETHLGWAMMVLGQQGVTPVFDGATEDEIHRAVDEANKAVRERRKEREKGHKPLADRELDVTMGYGGKAQPHDVRTGEPFEQRTTVGYIYMMKLHHLVDDKIHARATGPYSLITQQPLGGKARTGGQRFGEMEVWGLEAYGAAYILQELLTVKSDDVEGRTKIYESMVKGTNTLEAGTPVSFDVLCNEISGLGLNIQLEKKKGLRAEDEDGDLM